MGRIFNSRGGSDSGWEKASERTPFEWLLHGSVAELSASESLENNELGIEATVSVDPWLQQLSAANRELVRELKEWDSGMPSR